MVKRLLTSALFAGFAVGLLVALLQYSLVERLILVAEDYESGALVHFQGAGGGAAEADHGTPGHNDTATLPQQTVGTETAAMDATEQPAAHEHHHESDGDASPFVRHGLTVLFAILTYSGFAMVMAAGYALAEGLGIRLTVRDGLLWGLAGFAAVQLAPALGLEPELPGTPAADLSARQLWWFGTLVATAGGLALLAYGRGGLPKAAGLVLLVLPHAIGAPEIEHYAGIVPPELSSSFAARSLGVGLVAWVTLGGLLASLWSRPEHA